MAEAYNTLAELVQLNDKNLADYDISDLLEGAPVLQMLTAVPASNGTVHKYMKQTVASSVAFRAALTGIAKTPSQDQLVTDTLKILDGSFSTDVALAKGYKDGVDAWLQKELQRTLRQAMAHIERQVFYGVGGTGDSSGFVGLVDDVQLDAIGDTMLVNAGGSNADTQTSCFILRHGEQDVAVVAGNDGNFELSHTPTIIEKYTTAELAASTSYPAYYVSVIGYMGFQIGSAFSAARIANIECNSLGSTSAFTTDHIYAALSKFPGAAPPNLICMNRNAQRMLRQSLTATNPTGAPAPFLSEVAGIPIVITDQLASTEAVEV